LITTACCLACCRKLPSTFAITCLLALICGQQLVTVIYASSLGPPPGLLLSAGNNLPAVTSSSDNGATMNIPRRALMGSQKAEFIPFIIKGLVFLGELVLVAQCIYPDQSD